MGQREKMQVEVDIGSRWYKTLTVRFRSLGLVLSEVGAFHLNFLVLFLCCPFSLP